MYMKVNNSVYNLDLMSRIEFYKNGSEYVIILYSNRYTYSIGIEGDKINKCDEYLESKQFFNLENKLKTYISNKGVLNYG